MLELSKNVPILLQKEVKETKVELRWTGDFDCDVYAFGLGVDGKMINGDTSLCFFNQVNLFNGAIKHSGDMRNGDTAQADAPDEFMTFNLQQIPNEIKKVIVIASIYEAPINGKKFGQMSQMEATILNDNVKIATVNMADNYGDSFSLECLEFKRNEQDRWTVTPIQNAGCYTLNNYFAQYSK